MLKAETIRKLEGRQQELADLFLAESDPATFPDLSTKQNRGDRYWLKRNAAQTVGLVHRIQSLLDRALTPAAPPPDTPTPGDQAEAELEHEVALTTKEADELIAKVRARKPAK